MVNKCNTVTLTEWRTGRRIALGALLLCLASCSPREGQLTGSVFVVTRGGENVKLALVPVSVIPEDVLRAHVDRRRARADEERATVIQTIKDAQTSADAAW